MKLAPTTQEEILFKAKDRVWDIKAVHAINCEKIKKWLFEKAEESLRGVVAGYDQKNKKAVIEKTKGNYSALSDDLEKLYTIDVPINSKQMTEAHDGTLQEKAPSDAAIFAWLFTFVAAGFFEFAFFGYLVFASKGAGFALLGLALVLFIGGSLAGHGTAQIMIHGKQSEEDEDKTYEYKIEKKYIGMLIAGVVLVAVVAILRGVFGGILAAIVAVLFGSTVMITETFWLYYKAMRKYYLDKMFKAQEFYAAKQLSIELKEKGNPTDDTWWKHYKQYIYDIVGKIEIATSDKENPENASLQSVTVPAVDDAKKLEE